MYHDVIIAGTGGQGILLIGNLLAETAMEEAREVTFLPSYGVEMRGGNANCTVVISDKEVGSPSVNSPEVLIALSKKAQALFEPKIQSKGVFILNSSLVSPSDVRRDDVELIALPFNEIATDLGNARLANMVALGAYIARSGVVKVETLMQCVEDIFAEKYKEVIPQNIEAIRRGVALVTNE